MKLQSNLVNLRGGGGGGGLVLSSSCSSSVFQGCCNQEVQPFIFSAHLLRLIQSVRKLPGSLVLIARHWALRGGRGWSHSWMCWRPVTSWCRLARRRGPLWGQMLRQPSAAPTAATENLLHISTIHRCWPRGPGRRVCVTLPESLRQRSGGAGLTETNGQAELWSQDAAASPSWWKWAPAVAPSRTITILSFN